MGVHFIKRFSACTHWAISAWRLKEGDIGERECLAVMARQGDNRGTKMYAAHCTKLFE